MLNNKTVKEKEKEICGLSYNHESNVSASVRIAVNLQLVS